MLFVLISTFLGVWACAYVAVASQRGRLAFWLFYGVAVALVPTVCVLGLRLLFEVINPAYAASISATSLQVSWVLALVAYPVKYLRAKHEY